MGGCIFAERAVTDYNDEIRRKRRALERSQKVWSEEMEIRERVMREMELEESIKAEKEGAKG